MKRSLVVVAVAAVGVGVAACSGGSTATPEAEPSVVVVDPLDESTDPVVDEPDEPSASGVLTASDFVLRTKTTKRKCFGSVGCNVSLRIVPVYQGDSSELDGRTIEIVYRVSGDESGPIIGSIELDDGQYSKHEAEVSLSTRSSSVKPKASVVSVEEW